MSKAHRIEGPAVAVRQLHAELQKEHGLQLSSVTSKADPEGHLKAISPEDLKQLVELFTVVATGTTTLVTAAILIAKKYGATLHVLDADTSKPVGAVGPSGSTVPVQNG